MRNYTHQNKGTFMDEKLLYFWLPILCKNAYLLTNWEHFQKVYIYFAFKLIFFYVIVRFL